MVNKKLLWEPSAERREQANITRFIRFINERYGLDIKTHDELYHWSIDKISDFWAAMWEFGEIRASRGYDEVVDDLSRFPGAKWFGGSRLNFAENLLRYQDERTAFIFRGEKKKTARITCAELYRSVGRLARSLRDIGVVSGDRVAAYMPNLIETAVAMLNNTNELSQMPGPKGLPGGYSVRVNADGAEVVLPEGITMKEATEVNLKALKYDGIEAIKDDGTIVFTDECRQLVKEYLGADIGQDLKLEDAVERAKEVKELTNKVAAKYNIKLEL
ncbi:AMP-binding protein [Chloroflexota bacterium]